jgi:hypothetical protein
MSKEAAPGVVLQCTSCGAASLVPPELVSTGCTYCHSRLVDSERAAPIVDRVAPFRISRRAAQERIAQHLASRWWAPEALRRRARKGELMPDTMRGVLVPFYVYDATCRSRFRTQVGVHWTRSETRYEPGVGGKPGERVTEQVQETEWFPLAGTSVADWHDHLVSASAGLGHEETRALAPFDLGRAVAFDARLLAGWEAELPSRERAAVDGDAVAQLRRLEARRVTDDVLPGDTHRHTSVECDVQVRGVRLALLPVWVVTWRYGEKAQRLLIHGQTGRCVGGAPISRPKIAALSALVAAIVLVILWKTGVLPWPR